LKPIQAATTPATTRESRLQFAVAHPAQYANAWRPSEHLRTQNVLTVTKTGSDWRRAKVALATV
jgi:hypothetical protein